MLVLAQIAMQTHTHMHSNNKSEGVWSLNNKIDVYLPNSFFITTQMLYFGVRRFQKTQIQIKNIWTLSSLFSLHKFKKKTNMYSSSNSRVLFFTICWECIKRNRHSLGGNIKHVKGHIWLRCAHCRSVYDSPSAVGGPATACHFLSFPLWALEVEFSKKK